MLLSSSMVEHSAVNRRVVGSNPTWGAKSSFIDDGQSILAAHTALLAKLLI